MGRLGVSFQSDKSIGEYRALAEIVDRYDFETVSVYQDLFYQQPWPALLQFGERTTTPLVGPAVVNPYLTHPVVIASELAVLDEVSRGRAYLGVGRGAYFDAIDVAQPRALRAIREAVELVQRLLTGDRTPYEGEIFRASDEAYLRFPVPGRALPVLIGAWGKRTVELAGEIADMLKIGGSVDAATVPTFRDYLKTGAERAGRDPEQIRLIYGAVTAVDRDRGVAEAIARRNVARYLEVVAPDRADLSADELRRFACFGTPEDIVRQLEALFEAGVDRFELGTPHGIDEAEAVRVLGEEVLPHFED